MLSSKYKDKQISSKLFVNKILNTNVGSRDISQQEIVHTILRFKKGGLLNHSFKVINIGLDPYMNTINSINN